MVRAICERMGLEHIVDDKELREFSQATSVETLTQRLEDTLPDPSLTGKIWRWSPFELSHPVILRKRSPSQGEGSRRRTRAFRTIAPSKPRHIC